MNDLISFFAKLMLAAASLSPMLGAFGVNLLAKGKAIDEWLPWFVLAVILVAACLAILWFASNNCEKYSLRIKEFENADKEVLAFLVAYLLPFMASDSFSVDGQLLVSIYVISILVLTVVHTGSLTFNPIIGMFYHFYNVKNQEGESFLIITRTRLVRTSQCISVVKLGETVFLEKSVGDA
ncbi:hypothetical protein [uncultured Mesotoga sp.]|uniref:hypothetical protein n=1 Tax=Mesotoga sp. TaxID=2053577 RepID=UPI0025979687|nr:hypothetical protein [uncultured Mesotoga sp.]